MSHRVDVDGDVIPRDDFTSRHIQTGEMTALSLTE